MYKILEKKPIQEDDDSEIEYFLCLIRNEETQEETQDIILHIYEVELYEMLSHIQKSLGLYQETMKEIGNKIENYGELKRNELVINSIKNTLNLNLKK